MKPNASATLYRNDAVVETIQMRIDAASTRHIISLLTDMYPDPELAVVREYATNAWDSHIAAGVTRPIEITLPTENHRRYVVRDFGVGLSVDDIRDIYSAYGASTKRETNDQSGMLGLGCKSALTYSNSFTIDSVKNGVRTIASVTKDEFGIGCIKILDTSATDDDNGVTITIPTKDYGHQVFHNKARDFFPYWRGGVLVDGKEPEPIQGAFELDPDVMLLSNNRRIIVMGNVPYSVPGHANQGWVAWVEMGAIEFTPARELSMTELTKATIKTIEDFVRERLPVVIDQTMAASATQWDRILRYDELRQAGVRGGLFQHLKSIMISEDDYRIWTIDHGKSSSTTSYGPDSIIRAQRDGRKFITNFPYKRVSPTHIARLDASLDATRYVVFPTQIRNLHEFNGMPATNWSQIPELPKEEREKLVVARTRSKYRVWSGGKWADVWDDEVDSAKLYFGRTSTFNFQEVSAAFDDISVVELDDRRVDKFRRNYPHAAELQPFLDGQIKKLVDKLTETDTLYASIHALDHQFLAGYEGRMSPDEELNKLIRAKNLHDTSALAALAKLNRFTSVIVDDRNISRFLRTNGSLQYDYWRKPQGSVLCDRYPLFMEEHRRIDAATPASKEYVRLYHAAHHAS